MHYNNRKALLKHLQEYFVIKSIVVVRMNKLQQRKKIYIRSNNYSFGIYRCLLICCSSSTMTKALFQYYYICFTTTEKGLFHYYQNCVTTTKKALFPKRCNCFTSKNLRRNHYLIIIMIKKNNYLRIRIHNLRFSFPIE